MEREGGSAWLFRMFTITVIGEIRGRVEVGCVGARVRVSSSL